MSNNSEYQFLVTLAARCATISALILLSLKLYAWYLTDASSLLASATDSLLDLGTSGINLLILRYALMPADDEHKFGHGKAESLAGLIQAAFVMGSALMLFATGVDRTLKPMVLSATSVGITISVISLVVTIGLVLLQRYVVNKTQSTAISADAMHYQSDILLNIGVIAALFFSNDIFPAADGLFTIAVGIFLLIGALKIIRVSLKHLMDHQLPNTELEQIRQIALAHPKSLGIHDLRTRQSGQDTFIQFHLELADDIPLIEAHDISDEIEANIIALYDSCQVIIHQDPISAVKQEPFTDDRQTS